MYVFTQRSFTTLGELPDGFSWYLIFADRNNIPHPVLQFVVDIWWRFRIGEFLTQIILQIRKHEHISEYTTSQRFFEGSSCVVKHHHGCFTNVLRALQNNLAKIYNARNHIYSEKFKLKLSTYAQSIALCMHTKFQLEILIRRTISAIHKFRKNIFRRARETLVKHIIHTLLSENIRCALSWENKTNAWRTLMENIEL